MATDNDVRVSAGQPRERASEASQVLAETAMRKLREYMTALVGRGCFGKLRLEVTFQNGQITEVMAAFEDRVRFGHK